MQCVARVALTRGFELKRQPAILTARRLSPTEIRATDIMRSEARDREVQIFSDFRTHKFLNL